MANFRGSDYLQCKYSPLGQQYENDESCTYYSTDELKVCNQNTTCLMKTEEQSTEYGLKKACSPLYNQGKSILVEFSLVKLDFAKSVKKK